MVVRILTEPPAEILAVILLGLLLAKIAGAILRQSAEATVIGGMRWAVGGTVIEIAGVSVDVV